MVCLEIRGAIVNKKQRDLYKALLFSFAIKSSNQSFFDMVNESPKVTKKFCDTIDKCQYAYKICSI